MLLQKRILEWTKGLPDWQRDLARRVASGMFSDSDRKAVLAMLLEDEGAPAASPLELEHLPADEGEYGRVELTSISDLRNINLLAGGQNLSMAPGLNIVFGLTGAGKSGYGRLLCQLCRAAHQEDVLRDVFDAGSADAAQTARINVTVGGSPTELEVDLAGTPPRELSSIAVFNSQCAGVYLSGPTTVEHVPRPMKLLKEMVDAQAALGRELDERIGALLNLLPALPTVDANSPAAPRVASISAMTDLTELERWATLSDDEITEFERLEAAEAAVKADKGREIEAAARANARAATTALATLRQAVTELTDAKLDDLRGLRARFDAAIENERDLAEKAFFGQRFPGTGQAPWREMWESARRFVEAGGGAFPDAGPDAACPTCQQDLDADAKKRMAAFEKFVREDLGQRTSDARSALVTATEAIPNTNAIRASVEAVVDRVSDSVSVVADEALGVLAAREELAHAIAAGVQEPASPASLIELAAIAEYAKAQTEAADRQAAMRDENGQRQLRIRLSELRDRRTVSAALSSIGKHVGSLREVAQLEQAKDKLGSRGISGQLRDLQRAVITDRLRDAVERELEGLDPVAGRVEVVGQASKGETVIRLRLKEAERAKVGNVLSEGEQRALGLAFFLADVAVSEDNSAIVLDDPISSLDHERRTYVARRLAEEARRRQVVVLTHDFTFVHLLQEAAEEADIGVTGRTLQRAYHQVGLVSDDLPTKIKAPAKLRRELGHRLKSELEPLHSRQDPAYEREADRWAADLRKAYDQLIEDYVLAGTIRRWHRQVRLRQLRRITWSMDVVRRIEKAVKTISNKAHFEAPELQSTPFPPTELSEMLNEYDELCKLTNPETRAATVADADASAEDDGLRVVS